MHISRRKEQFTIRVVELLENNAHPGW